MALKYKITKNMDGSKCGITSKRTITRLHPETIKKKLLD
jgi:hypothetical protein